MAKVVQLRNIKRALKLEPNEAINYLIGGRVSNFRVYKSFNFIDLTDGSTQEHLQLVVKKDLIKKPELGSYIVCRGNLIRSKGQQQNVEFKVTQVDQASSCDADKWPLAAVQKNDLSDGWYRDHLHLRPQAPHFASLLRVRSELELSLHMIFKQMDFFKVHTPILSSNDSEASSDLFMVQRSWLMDKGARRQETALDHPDDYDDEDDENNNHDDGTDQDKRDRDVSCGTEADTNSQMQASRSRLKEAQSRALERDYFNKDVYMVTSAQLHLESLAASLSRVYCLSPTFRAENSLSRLHLCEFTMLEAEEANLTRLEPLMDRVESILKFSAQFIRDISEFSNDFCTLLDKYSNHATYEKLAHSKYIRLTYEEALKVLRALHAQPTAVSSGLLSDLPLSACHYGCDISRRHERHLLNYYNNVPIFITHYPKGLKPFYMKCADNGSEALCFDLIAPFGGEICGGSLREDNLDRLSERLKSMHSSSSSLSSLRRVSELSDRERADDNNGARIMARQGEEAARDFQWYLDLRKFGTFPHGGFGIGFERLIQSLLGIRNIKDTIAFPRWAGNCRM